MQEESSLNSTFVNRTDRLAHKLGLNVQDLPDVIGVSRRTLFAGRGEGGKISGRTWIQLETAERAAGIAPEPEREVAEPEPSRVSEDSAGDRTDRLERKLDRLEEMMEEILRCMKDHSKK